MMLTILSALLGFFGPFVPELIKLIRQKMDNTQELAVLRLQIEATKIEQSYRMEEIGVASASVQTIMHQPEQSFGVQMLDAAKGWPKVLILPIFYLFSFLDFISGLVRPGVTYAMVGFYLSLKWAMFDLMKTDHSSWQSVIQNVWTENDWAVLLLVLGFYFGQRTVKATFGGSASTGKSGGG